MKTNPSNHRSIITFIFWVIITTIGWGLANYVGFRERNSTINSPSMITELIVSFTLNGLLLGTIVGLGQWLILQLTHKTTRSINWLLGSILGYSVGFPAGFIIAISIIMISFSLFGHRIIKLGDLGSSPAFISVPLLLMMVISGAIIGFFQSKAVLYRVDKKVSLLWITFSALFWAIAFVAASSIGQDLPLIAESTAAGTIIGIASGIPIILIGIGRIGSYTQNRLQQR